MRETWDPFQLMREMMQWNPNRELTREGTAAITFVPDFDVKETKDAYVFHADLPGLKEEDLDISLLGNRLTIKGKREAEERKEGDTYYTYERSYGSFQRSFTLPESCDIDHVNAELKHGVLTLTVPKAAVQQPKKISLKGMVDKVKGTLKD